MNKTISISIPAADVAVVPPSFRSFLLDNFEDLEWALAASGAHEQLAALRGLAEDIYEETAEASDAYDILDEIRLVFDDLPIHNPFDHLAARPDFDACLRWLGARLDEFVSRANEG